MGMLLNPLAFTDDDQPPGHAEPKDELHIAVQLHHHALGSSANAKNPTPRNHPTQRARITVEDVTPAHPRARYDGVGKAFV